MSMVRIGPYTLPNQVILAPMAGVTDRPFRQLCRRMGAGLVVAEMLSPGEREWWNAYHAEVLVKIGPRVEPAVRDWLEAACAPL